LFCSMCSRSPRLLSPRCSFRSSKGTLANALQQIQLFSNLNIYIYIYIYIYELKLCSHTKLHTDGSVHNVETLKQPRVDRWIVIHLWSEMDYYSVIKMRPAWSTEWVPGQLGLQRETLSWKTKNKTKNY
jgi:hypothetical protein